MFLQSRVKFLKKTITLTGSVEEYNVYNKVNVKICKVMGLAEV